MLGTLQDLPVDYRSELTDRNLVPLWPALRNLLPTGRPVNNTLPIIWPYQDIRPQLLRAGELTPIEKAERRVLVLANPGLQLETMRATPTIYAGMQLILPGETAPCHRHTPSAIRFVVEGTGAYTLVNGHKCVMNKGDLILTPSGLWHEHGHNGSEPVVWLDALDLPLIYGMEASYAVEGGQIEPCDVQPDSEHEHEAQVRYAAGGLVPYSALDVAYADYPMLRYPWNEVKTALANLASRVRPGEVVQLAYVNPKTGQECLPTLGFSALLLRPAEQLHLPVRSASAVMHVVEGFGRATVDGVEMQWQEADSFVAPTHARIELSNESSREAAYLFVVDDAPLQRRIGVFEANSKIEQHE